MMSNSDLDSDDDDRFLNPPPLNPLPPSHHQSNHGGASSSSSSSSSTGTSTESKAEEPPAAAHIARANAANANRAKAKTVTVAESQGQQQQGGGQADDTIIIRTTPEKLKQAELSLFEIQNLNVVPESLYKYSLRATFFHFAQAIALFYFASQETHTKWQVFTSYPEPEDDALSHPPLGPDSTFFASFSILWYSPIFITLAAMEHGATLIFKHEFEHFIARNQNPFRWTEYTFSASLMRVMVAQFAGITDVHLLIITYMLGAITMQLGAAHEVFNAKARADGHVQNWTCYYLSWVAQLVSWLVILNYFGMRVRGGSQPRFIWVIMIVMFLLDSSFAIVFHLQWAKIPPFDDYVAGEKAFIVLSFFAKTLLAWIGFGGVYRSY